MDKYQTEIFGEFTYAESLTYEDLLNIEEDITREVDTIFLDAGAEHLDFTPHGDLLMFQCAFECRNMEIFRDIADELAMWLPKGVRGRILCLDKDLYSYSLFWISPGQWQEKAHIFPVKGPQDIPIHIVKREL